MRVRVATTVAAPPEVVWAFVGDPTRALHYMAGITRFEVVSGEPTGVGARYRVLIRVGSAEVGSLVEVVESVPARELAWNSVTGVDQRLRWRLRPEADGRRTRVELRLAYGVAGTGLTGWLAERFSARQVTGHLRRTLAQLSRQVEHEQTRRSAAARREARTAAPAR